MRETWLRPAPGKKLEPALAGALAQAAAALARLDQALAGHPLVPAFLHRTRLEAVRRQAAVDGQLIDPWHLAAVLEGFRLRMDGALRIIDRGAILAAARHALDLHQWLVAPDFDQEGDVQRAEQVLTDTASSGTTPLLAAAAGLHAWLGGDGHAGGGARPPIRAALVRFWMTQRLLRAPVPLTGARALRPDTPWQRDVWVPAFLSALADEAADGLELLLALERTWRAARRAVSGRRRHSRAAAAVDILAAAPLVSARSLAAGLGMAVNNATLLLDDFCAAGLVVEVTHRAKRRLFGLTGLAPLRDVVRPPYRPEPGRGRGRPAAGGRGGDHRASALPSAPLTPIRSPAVRLQRPRPLDDPDGPDHPSDAARAECRGPVAPAGHGRGQRSGGHKPARQSGGYGMSHAGRWLTPGRANQRTAASDDVWRVVARAGGARGAARSLGR